MIVFVYTDCFYLKTTNRIGGYVTKEKLCNIEKQYPKSDGLRVGLVLSLFFL